VAGRPESHSGTGTAGVAAHGASRAILPHGRRSRSSDFDAGRGRQLGFTQNAKLTGRIGRDGSHQTQVRVALLPPTGRTAQVVVVGGLHGSSVTMVIRSRPVRRCRLHFRLPPRPGTARVPTMVRICRVEDGRGSLEPIGKRPVSHPRSSNPTCRFPALGFPIDFTARHTTVGRSMLVSCDDTSARTAFAWR